MSMKSITTDELIDYFEYAADDPDAHPDAADIAADLRLYKDAYESGVITTATLKRHWTELKDRISQFDLDLLLLEAGGFDEEELAEYSEGYPFSPNVEITEESCDTP